MQLTLFWFEAILDFLFHLCTNFFHKKQSCKARIVVALPSSLPFTELFLTASGSEQKLPLFWISLFSSGEIYSVVTDNCRNTTCPLGHELCHGSTDLSLGCWDPTVRAAWAADVPRSPWAAQGSPEPRVSWFRQLCWADTHLDWGVIAGLEKCQHQRKERGMLS